MQWTEIRQHYPHQWLLLEAIKARSEAGQRILEELSVVDTFSRLCGGDAVLQPVSSRSAGM